MATRPNIKILKGVDNDVYALLNAQTGYPPVTVGDVLRIQNKGGSNIYIHEALTSDTVNGGTTISSDIQATTKLGSAGVIATCIADSVINVEVL